MFSHTRPRSCLTLFQHIYNAFDGSGKRSLLITTEIDGQFINDGRVSLSVPNTYKSHQGELHSIMQDLTRCSADQWPKHSHGPLAVRK